MSSSDETDAEELAQKSSRRRRGAWAQGTSKRVGWGSVVPQPPLDDMQQFLGEDVLGGVAAEIATTEEWAQVSDDIMKIYTPSVCRAGADAYARQISTADEAPTLRWIRAETRRRFSVEEASMQVFPEQGKWLSQLVVALNASKVLELGTFTGYSSTCIAAALPPDGRLMCADVSERYTSLAQEAWKRAALDHKISLHIGPALPFVDTLLAPDLAQRGTFDLVFIDADKENYLAYYDAAIDLVRPGGAICFDDSLWSGRVVEDSGAYDRETEAIRAVNSFLAQDPRVLTLVHPIGDGVTVAIKKVQYAAPTPGASATLSAAAAWHHSNASALFTSAQVVQTTPRSPMSTVAGAGSEGSADAQAPAPSRRGGWGTTGRTKKTTKTGKRADTVTSGVLPSSTSATTSSAVTSGTARSSTREMDAIAANAASALSGGANTGVGLGAGGFEVHIQGNMGAGKQDLARLLSSFWRANPSVSSSLPSAAPTAFAAGVVVVGGWAGDAALLAALSSATQDGGGRDSARESEENKGAVEDECEVGGSRTTGDKGGGGGSPALRVILGAPPRGGCARLCRAPGDG